MKSIGFQIEYPISQLINPLKGNDIYCYEIKNKYNCFNYLFNETKTEYNSPNVQINEDDLDKSLKEHLGKRFTNFSNICPHFGWLD